MSVGVLLSTGGLLLGVVCSVLGPGRLFWAAAGFLLFYPLALFPFLFLAPPFVLFVLAVMQDYAWLGYCSGVFVRRVVLVFRLMYTPASYF